MAEERLTKRRPLDHTWTREKLLGLKPDAPFRQSAVAWGVEPDLAAMAALRAFLAAKSSGWLWDVDRIVGATWEAVRGVRLYAATGATWTSYKDAATDLLRKADNLRDAADAFAWQGRLAPSPVGYNQADWLRLADLLRRAHEEMRDEPTRAPLPEFDQAYHAALELVRRRTNTAAYRLNIAVSAIEAVQGRPRGSYAAELARGLATLWHQFAGSKPTVSRPADGAPTGPFIEYCMRARDLLPVDERRLLPLTAEVVEKACRNPTT